MGVEFRDRIRQSLVEKRLRLAKGRLDLVIKGQKGKAFLKTVD